MVKYSALNTDIESVKRSLDNFHDRLREVTLTLRTSRNIVINWEEAPDLANPFPFKPSWRQNILVGFLLSFALACLIVFGIEQIDDTVHTPMDLERRMGATVIGSVPACGSLGM